MGKIWRRIWSKHWGKSFEFWKNIHPCPAPNILSYFLLFRTDGQHAKMSKHKGKEEDHSKMMTLGDKEHSCRLSSGLNQLRKESSFCDVTIIVGDQRFPAHKAVLSCASEYFQGMFSTGFQESAMSEVTVPGMNKVKRNLQCSRHLSQ